MAAPVTYLLIIPTLLPLFDVLGIFLAQSTPVSLCSLRPWFPRWLLRPSCIIIHIRIRIWVSSSIIDQSFLIYVEPTAKN